MAGFGCSSKRIHISNIYPTYSVTTWDSIPFLSHNHPSRNHPREAARSTLRCRVSILKITISRRLPSFFIFFRFFPSRLIFSLSTSTSADALRFLLSSVFPLGNGPDVWRNTRNPIATLRIVGTSSFFLLIYETRESEKERKTDERTVDKEREGEMRNSSWFSSSLRRTRGLDERECTG